MAFIMDQTLERFWISKFGQVTEDIAAAKTASDEEGKKRKRLAEEVLDTRKSLEELSD